MGGFLESVLGQPGMPVGQVNANVGDELVMRVGVPETGGKLTMNAFNEAYPVMVSASAFWNAKAGKFSVPEACNLYELDLALDSAGFTAMKLWASKGKQAGIAGVFPWTWQQYVELAAMVPNAWWSQPDLCCEPEIASSQEEIDYRVNATATLLEGTLRMVYQWQEELAKECSPSTVASMLKPCTPILQGWSASDYLRSLDLLMEVWSRWQPWVAAPTLIGIGSVCRRNLAHPRHGLYAILAALEGRLPEGCKVHLFGVKGGALDEIKMMPWVAGADSMAYDYSARVKARQSGRSNSVELRSKEMSAWMASAARRMAPAIGDQFRLSFA